MIGFLVETLGLDCERAVLFCSVDITIVATQVVDGEPVSDCEERQSRLCFDEVDFSAK